MGDETRAVYVPKIGQEITHSARMKSYPDGSFEIMAADSSCFRAPGWEGAKHAAGGSASQGPCALQ